MMIVADIDDSRRATSETDFIKIVSVVAIQGENTGHAAHAGLVTALIVVHSDDVVSAAEFDRCRAGDGLDVNDIVWLLVEKHLRAGINRSCAGQCAFHKE